MKKWIWEKRCGEWGRAGWGGVEGNFPKEQGRVNPGPALSVVQARRSAVWRARPWPRGSPTGCVTATSCHRWCREATLLWVSTYMTSFPGVSIFTQLTSLPAVIFLFHVTTDANPPLLLELSWHQYCVTNVMQRTAVRCRVTRSHAIVCSDWQGLQRCRPRSRTRSPRLWSCSSWPGRSRISSPLWCGISPRFFHSQQWSLPNSPCCLTRNITPHCMETLAFHSLLRWKIIILPISLPHLYIFSWKG